MVMSNTSFVTRWDGHEDFNIVGLVARPISLRVMFGCVENNRVKWSAIAVFPHSQHPELKEIHDGYSWDVDVIKGFLSTLMLSDLPSGLLGLRVIE